ncbi:peptidoglycan DD-metalloendopeptidase family protein [Skermania sp. ID1734]|uniref:peptidoglycan DD-metalloendopeptidase family protein n=1 Tax=Skermania sp. ID1734 TaxID=2597516 RepID=UPI00117DC8D8|nr:peptidoglycan DD-metalloendopeptidase family protein [Skermania sp. ID1734]TSD94832.1 peptidoglycan DD-metalloendopeptidase family protein [Skermania sp. ID1734]
MEQAKGSLLGVLAMFFAVILGIFLMVASCGAAEEEAARSNCDTGSSSRPSPGRATGVSKPMRTGTFEFTSGYGSRTDPLTGETAMHEGVDLAADDGTPIYAYAPGVVIAAGGAGGFGQWIVIDHNLDGQIVSTVYGHMWDATKFVKTGDQVLAGQQIAEVGSNGESTGAHLHFEYWIGGHRDFHGGTSTDPKPIVEAAPEPGEATTPGEQSTSAAPAPNADLAAAVTPGGSLPPLPASVGSEEHLQVASIRVARAVLSKFPQLQTIGGWRPDGGGYNDHPDGRAVDIMIPNYSSGEGVELGTQINDYVLNNAETFGVEYTIWRQTYYTPGGEASPMEDRGGDTANHMDHVHVTTFQSGFPNGSEAFSAPPGGGPSRSGAVNCGQQMGGGVDNLAPGRVPAEYEPWLRRAGTMCPQISSALLAGDQKQESQFNRFAQSPPPANAKGPAQFIDDTWPAYGQDDDGNGQISPFDIGDATMAQARYFCENARTIDAAIDAGTVHPGPEGPVGLYVAAYNAGVGAVLTAGGMPSGGDYTTQTAPYVTAVLEYARQFQAAGF